MSRKLIIGSARALLFASPVFGASSSRSYACRKDGADAYRYDKPFFDNKRQKTAMRERAHARRNKHKLSMNDTARGDREVRALNALEAARYQFTDLQPQGLNFVATA